MKKHESYDPSDISISDKYEKTGFSWRALFFGPFWLLFNKLWFHLTIFIASTMVINTIMITLTTIAEEKAGPKVLLLVLLMRLLIPIGAYLFIGFNGNAWVSKRNKSLVNSRTHPKTDLR